MVHALDGVFDGIGGRFPRSRRAGEAADGAGGREGGVAEEEGHCFACVLGVVAVVVEGFWI